MCCRSAARGDSDGFLAEIVIDPERPLLGVGRRHGIIDDAAGGEIGPQGLFQRQPDTRPGQPCRRQPGDCRSEQAGRRGQENRQLRRIANRLRQRCKAFGLAGIERHIAEPRQKARNKRRRAAIGIDKAFERLGGERPEFGIVMLAARRSNDAQAFGQQAIGIKAEQRWQQHAFGQVAGGAEQQQVRTRCGHHAFLNRKVSGSATRTRHEASLWAAPG